MKRQQTLRRRSWALDFFLYEPSRPHFSSWSSSLWLGTVPQQGSPRRDLKTSRTITLLLKTDYSKLTNINVTFTGKVLRWKLHLHDKDFHLLKGSSSVALHRSSPWPRGILMPSAIFFSTTALCNFLADTDHSLYTEENVIV